MGAGRAIRRYVFPILVSVAAPICAIWFSLSPRVVDGSALEDQPIGWYVEVTVDHLQPLPWTIKDERGWITGRYLVGWIGGRALLVQADREVRPA
jgi:hypothetical protein